MDGAAETTDGGETMSAEQLQLVGFILFGVGLCLFISGAGEAPLFDPPEDEVPGAPGVPRIPTKETR